MKLKILIIVLVLGLAGILAYVFLSPSPETANVSTPSDEVMVEDAMMKKEEDSMMFQFSGVLYDVTKGKTVTGVNTKGRATGMAHAKFEDGTYNLLVTFENLPDPQGTDFYEGWIVRRGVRFHVISSSKAEKINGVYQNSFQSDQDLTDHDFYVLTIEPDDGNPDPAEHILEGTME